MGTSVQHKGEGPGISGESDISPLKYPYEGGVGPGICLLLLSLGGGRGTDYFVKLDSQLQGCSIQNPRAVYL